MVDRYDKRKKHLHYQINNELNKWFNNENTN